jgi:RNA recognition motif-containing protein
VHGGKHTTLPSTWMQPTENGQGPRIIELSNEPALRAITINTADAYVDTDSEEYAAGDGKMMANPQGKVQKKKKKQKEEHTGSTSEISGSYSEAEEDEETSENTGGKEVRADRGQAKRTNETRPHDSLLSVRPGLAHTVFVGGLNFSTTERHLTAAFGGPELVASVRMPRRRDGRRRGLGFVEMKSRKLAQAALQKHGMLLMSRRINVRPALQVNDPHLSRARAFVDTRTFFFLLFFRGAERQYNAAGCGQRVIGRGKEGHHQSSPAWLPRRRVLLPFFCTSIQQVKPVK